MSHDREMIAAYVDGELDLINARRIEKAMEEDAGLAAAVAAERKLRERLTGHFAPALDEPVPDRLTALLTAPGNVDSSLADRRAAREETKAWGLSGYAQMGAMAASLALGLIVGGYALRGNDEGYVRATPTAVVASGDLARALDTQLASNQKTDAKIRIGTSFEGQQRQFCRTFESATLDGIACNSGGVWELRRMQFGGASGEYRQASSGELADAAAAMMAGEPFNAAQEKAARDKRWKQ